MKKNTRRGETLVETIVAFLVMLVLLSMVTLAVRGGIALNQRAIARTADLEAACTTAEQAGGDPLTEAGAKLTVSFNMGAAQTNLEIPLEVRQAKPGQIGILYFLRKAGG